MNCRTIVLALFLLVSLPLSAADPTCAEQKQGKTTDGDAVVVCTRLFPSAPFVRLPENQRGEDGQVTMNGVVELTIRQTLENARFYDRDLMVYDLVDANGKPISESSPILKKNQLPSNRVHFLVYEAKGKVLPAAKAGGTPRLQLAELRPIVLVDGRAIDERFLGVWEGTVSKRFGDKQWYTDLEDGDPDHFAKIRINFQPPLTPMENIGVLSSTPKLEDGTRFKALGKFENATQPVRLSTGECAPALTSYGDANPFPPRVAITNYSILMWRFPAMHSRSSADFHIVFEYPVGLYPRGELQVITSMARDHNFRLKDYIATSTQPKALVYGIHGSPVDQILFLLKPVQGGGGQCE